MEPPVRKRPLLAVALGAFVPFAAMQVPPVSAGLVIDRARAIRRPIGRMRISASTKS